MTGRIIEAKMEKLVMKIVSILSLVVLLVACGNDHGETGVINDGIEPFDSNGALIDSNGKGSSIHPSTDTGIGEDRVDIQPRGGSSSNIQDTTTNNVKTH